MTEQEIERFQQYQEIENGKAQLESFLSDITESIEQRKRFTNVVIRMFDSDGISHDHRVFNAPEIVSRELYDLIINVTKQKIAEFENTIKAL
jgi:hypothetical protein